VVPESLVHRQFDALVGTLGFVEIRDGTRDTAIRIHHAYVIDEVGPRSPDEPGADTGLVAKLPFHAEGRLVETTRLDVQVRLEGAGALLDAAVEHVCGAGPDERVVVALLRDVGELIRKVLQNAVEEPAVRADEDGLVVLGDRIAAGNPRRIVRRVHRAGADVALTALLLDAEAGFKAHSRTHLHLVPDVDRRLIALRRRRVGVVLLIGHAGRAASAGRQARAVGLGQRVVAGHIEDPVGRKPEAVDGLEALPVDAHFQSIRLARERREVLQSSGDLIARP